MLYFNEGTFYNESFNKGSLIFNEGSFGEGLILQDDVLQKVIQRNYSEGEIICKGAYRLKDL